MALVGKTRLPMQETEEMRVQSLGRKSSWRRKWQLTLVFSLGESHEQRSLAGYSPWGHGARHDRATNTHTHRVRSLGSHSDIHLLHEL